jgi:hypothetical protein
MDEAPMQHRPTHVTGDHDPEAKRHVVAHREGVVRRLLHAGLSVRLLRLLLPEWSGLIERVASVMPALSEAPAEASA